jgi:hypothetical protein
MADISITFQDGQQHVYTNAPDEATPEQIYQRAQKDFPDRAIKSLDRKKTTGVQQAPEMIGAVGEVPVFGTPSERAGFERGQREASKGFLSGAAQTVTGAAELFNLPGSAEATRYLKSVGDPRFQTMGTLATGLAPGGMVAKALKLGPVTGSALTGALGGAIIPTGETDATKRYLEKGLAAGAGGLLGTLFAGLPIAYQATKQTISRALGREASAAEEALVKKAKDAADRGINVLSSEEKSKLSALAQEEARASAAEKVGAKAKREETEAIKGLAGARTVEQFGEYGVAPQTKQEIGEYLRTQAKNYIEPVKKIRNEKANAEISAARNAARIKETTSPFVKSEEMQSLLKKINAKLKTETDAFLVKQLQDVRKSLFKGTETARPTFESAETIRRKIGDAAFGVPEEGYAAIGQNLAKELYGSLSAAMKKYEPSFEKYLSRYKDLSENIEVAGSRLGKALMGVEKEAPSYYAVTADKLADRAFSSPENVKTLIDAFGGNKQPVVAAAERWMANQLSGKTVEEARKFLTSDKTRSLINELGSEFRSRIQSRYFIGASKQSERAAAAAKEFQAANENIEQIRSELEKIGARRSTISEGIAAIENAISSKAKQDAASALVTRLKTEIPANQYATLQDAVLNLKKSNESKTKARQILTKIGIPGTATGFGAYEYFTK